jgi:hypothetical protein
MDNLQNLREKFSFMHARLKNSASLALKEEAVGVAQISALS